MPPFIGPMTTGTPKPNSIDGSRGETGIGWWTTSMPCSATSFRTMRRCASCVERRERKPVVTYEIALGNRCPIRHIARCQPVSSMYTMCASSGYSAESSSRVRAWVTSHTGTQRLRSTRK